MKGIEQQVAGHVNVISERAYNNKDLLSAFRLLVLFD